LSSGVCIRHNLFGRTVLVCFLFLLGFPMLSRSDAETNAAIIQGIDAAVKARETHLLGYAVTEHYVVYRNHDEQHAAADMVVKTTYRRDAGKSFSVVSLKGSLLMRKMLEEVLATEKKMTQPANRGGVVIVSGNYEMSVKGPAVVDGRNCIAVAIKPRKVSPYLFNGTILVDAQNEAIVQLEGVAAKSPSFISGPSEVVRQYTMIDGFPMATHARAVSNSSLLGQTIVRIDYTGYQLNAGAAR
jgi:hypothetical protein